MKIDPTTPILDLDDKQVIDDVTEPVMMDGRQIFEPNGRPAVRMTGEKLPITFAVIAERVLRVQKQGMANDEQYRRFRLALLMHRAKGQIELPSEDAVFLKTAIGEAGFDPIIYGRAEDIIEGRDAPLLDYVPPKTLSEAA